MNQTYYPPNHKSTTFNCPICNVYTKHLWGVVTISGYHENDSWLVNVETFHESLSEYSMSASKCTHCGEILIWSNDQIVFPKMNAVPLPNADLPEDVKRDYKEAASILTDSPRASAALLRLALQKLCIHLGGEGNNINDDIGGLVKKGLDPSLQKALDVIRITGNNAVHPGEIDLTEDVERVRKLFMLINIVAKEMITTKKEIKSLFDELPEDTRKAINKRDLK